MAWNASTDNVGVAGYNAWLNGAKVGTTKATSYTFANLKCGTTYTVGLEAFDAAGNTSSRDAASGPMATLACATADPPADTTAPTTPGALSLSSITATSLTASWSASTDQVGVAGYSVYLNSSKQGDTKTLSQSLASLACDTSYTVAVDAFDAAGNRSAKATKQGRTSACSTAPPAGNTVA
jgi:chitinase